MKIEEKNIETVINMGALRYPADKIASILGENLQDIENELLNEGSQLSTLLKRGRDMADYVLDLKLFELAKSGDINAMDRFNLLINKQKQKK